MKEYLRNISTYDDPIPMQSMKHSHMNEVSQPSKCSEKGNSKENSVIILLLLQYMAVNKLSFILFRALNPVSMQAHIAHSLRE